MLDALSENLFKCLHIMDDEANSPSGYCSHAGLIDYCAYKGIQGRKYEKAWNDRLAELLLDAGYCVTREHNYPGSKKKCDLLIKADGKTIWLEVKAAWKSWFSSKTGKVETNAAHYHAYLFGDRNKTHSAAQDIVKLAGLTKEHADYICLLVIGFDSLSMPINPDIKQLAADMKLEHNNWQIYGPNIRTDRNQRDCRYNCWLFAKKADE